MASAGVGEGGGERGRKRQARRRDSDNAPPRMPVVLALGGQGVRAELQVQGTWPPLTAPGAPVVAAPAVPAVPAGPALSLWARPCQIGRMT